MVLTVYVHTSESLDLVCAANEFIISHKDQPQ